MFDFIGQRMNQVTVSNFMRSVVMALVMMITDMMMGMVQLVMALVMMIMENEDITNFDILIKFFIWQICVLRRRFSINADNTGLFLWSNL